MKKWFIIGLVLLLAVFLFFVFRHKKTAVFQAENKSAAAVNMAAAMDGEMVGKDTAQSRPIAVMVENHPDSWPQSGLSQADVVYETLAEGGITRFVALFQTQKPTQIGPVRSARDYFAQIADEWGAVYAHVGGSNEVIAELKMGEYKKLSDANEYYNGEYFTRLKNKLAPHNVFTSIESLQELMSARQYDSLAGYSPWQFKDDEALASSTAQKISIDFSRAGYEVGWEYDVSANNYKRLQYFQPHLDANTQKQITAKNVIIQMVDVQEVANDPLLHVNIDISSGGEAIVFLDGKAIEGTWKKIDGRTRYYDSAGAEISLNRGNIWVELVPQTKRANLKWQ